MPSLFRQKIVLYHTKQGKRCKSTTRGAVRTETESKKWYGEYKGPDGRFIRKPLSENKETARRMLSKLAGDAQLASVGIVDPFAEHRGRPILEHLEDFTRFLKARDKCREYVDKTVSQIKAIVAGCEFKTFDDIDAADVADFLADLRQKVNRPELPAVQEFFSTRDLARILGIEQASVNRMVKRRQLAEHSKKRKERFQRSDVEQYLSRRRGIGVQTSNHYLGAMRRFCRWMVKHRRTAFDPLASLSSQNVQVDIRHGRRSLTPNDFEQLVAAARSGKTFRGLTGKDREFIYVFASHTGLRCSELGSLTPASFDLDSSPPTVTVEAGYSKHRRKDLQVMRIDLAGIVREYIDGRPANDVLWPGSWTEAGAEMIRIDLESAGIPYVDETGRVYDFHALRHQFISGLALGGVHPKVAQELARHSDIRLTMNTYSHIGLLEHSAGLEKLPSIPRPESAKVHEKIAQ